MPNLSLRLKYDENTIDTTLHAIPSVHFRVPFAEEVLKICSAPETRPSAIALELGAGMAAAARKWLQELGVGPGHKKELPCMLGLIHINRYLHPNFRSMAEKLQGQFGALHQIPPDILKEMLGYSSVRVLYLSPIDSIIEAIRCSLELNIPLYGVDLEESAASLQNKYKIQDTLLAAENVDSFVEKNALYADNSRDEFIDSRREVAMAARLKTILCRHKNVLFVCGLAHWNEIENLMGDESLLPAKINDVSVIDNIDIQQYERVVVDPHLAIYHMDVFPFIVELYEGKRRIHTHRNISLEDILHEYKELLNTAYQKHFIDQISNKPQINRTREDLDASRDFERVMINLATVRLEVVPNLFTMLVSAHSTMSPAFFHILFETFTNFDWAKPKEFPNISVLMASPALIGSPVRGELAVPKHERGKYFYIDPLPGNAGDNYRIRIPPIIRDWIEVDPPPIGINFNSVTWPPCDDRMMALSLRAAELGLYEKPHVNITPFEGSLLDGLHIKTTLREFAKGRETYYVRERKRIKIKKSNIKIDPFPIVWILRPETDSSAKWKFFSRKISTMLENIEDKSFDTTKLNKLQEEYGGDVKLLLTCYKEKDLKDKDIFGGGINCYDMHGFLMLGPTCLPHIKQEAIWLDRTTVVNGTASMNTRALIVPDNVNTNSHIREMYGINIESSEWPTAFVRLAIHHAEDAVTIVAPDNFSLPSLIYTEAMSKGVQIRIVPLSFFPIREIRKLCTLYAVPGYYSYDGWKFPEAIIRYLGEKPDECRRLIPEYWLNYGLENKGCTDGKG